MNPYPFASLNHFTLPVAIYYPPTNVDLSLFPRLCRGNWGLRVRVLQIVSSPIRRPDRRCCEGSSGAGSEGLTEGLAKTPDSRRRVGGGHDRTDAGDAVRACGEDIRDVACVETTQ